MQKMSWTWPIWAHFWRENWIPSKICSNWLDSAQLLSLFSTLPFFFPDGHQVLVIGYCDTKRLEVGIHKRLHPVFRHIAQMRLNSTKWEMCFIHHPLLQLVTVYLSLLSQYLSNIVQGDPSGWSQPPVDMETNVAFQYMLLVLKRNFCFDVNRSLGPIWWVTLYRWLRKEFMLSYVTVQPQFVPAHLQE